MAEESKSLEELVKKLPPASQQEVRELVELLLKKQVKQSAGTLRQDWAGLLRNHRDQYTSLELQKRALEWRGD